MAGNMLDLDELIGSVQELLTALVKVKATIASNSSDPSTSKHRSSLRKKSQPQEEVKTSIPQALEYIYSEVVRLRTKLNLGAPEQVAEKNTSDDKFQKLSNDNPTDHDDQKPPEATTTANADQNHPDRDVEISTSGANKNFVDKDIGIQTGKNAAVWTESTNEKPTDNQDTTNPTGNAEKTLDGDAEIVTGNAEEKTLDGGAGIPTSNLNAKTLERGIEFPTRSANKHPNIIQPLHQKAINSLDDGQWLNDEVINAYIGFLKAKSNINVYFASTYFFSQLVPRNSSSIHFKAVSRWTKSVNLFEQKYAMYPIHQAGNHWSLAIVTNLSSLLAPNSPQSLTIITIDSLDPIANSVNHTIFDRLQEYVIEEAKAKLGTDIRSEVVLWKHAKHLPVQSNSFDCGVFMLLLLERFLQDPDAFMSAHPITIDSLQGRRHIRSTLLKAIPQQDINAQRNNDKKSSSDKTHVLTTSTSSLTTIFKLKDMGKSMVSTIEDFIARNTKKVYERGYFKAQIQSLPEIDWEQVSKNTTQPERNQLRALAFSGSCGGVARAHTAEPSCRKFVFPKVWEVPKNPSHSEARIEDSFQRTIDQPPRGSLSYYIGPPLLPTYTPIVDAGERLKRRGSGSLPGINQIYWYLSSISGTPAPMHIEDACLGSVNLLLAGHEKHWLFIPPSQREKLEQHIQICSNKHSHCSQFVRHEDLLLSPKLLREWGIDFYLDFCAAGEMIITLPETYHQVRNDGPNIAESVNFEFSTTPAMPIGYNWCKKDSCGQHVLTEPDFTLSSRTFQQTMPKSAEIKPCSLTDHSCLLADLTAFAQASDWDENDLSVAFADETLKSDERARIIQMIVQCSMVSFVTPKENADHRPRDRGAAGGEAGGARSRAACPGLQRRPRLVQRRGQGLAESKFMESVLEILNSFQEIEQRFTICSFEKSLYLIQLTQMFRQEEAVITEQMKERRKIRRREKGLPYKRETARTQVIDCVLAQMGDQNTPPDRRKLSRLINEGETLHTIKEAFGINMIALLSESSAQENHLTFPRGESCFKTLAKPIQPLEYNQLVGKSLEYFIRWVPILYPGVESVKDCRAIALDSSDWGLWKKEMQSLSEAVPAKRKSLSQLPKRAKIKKF